MFRFGKIFVVDSVANHVLIFLKFWVKLSKILVKYQISGQSFRSNLLIKSVFGQIEPSSEFRPREYNIVPSTSLHHKPAVAANKLTLYDQERYKGCPASHWGPESEMSRSQVESDTNNASPRDTASIACQMLLLDALNTLDALESSNNEEISKQVHSDPLFWPNLSETCIYSVPKFNKGKYYL